jgi:ribose transport system substrate-binding protein
MTRLSKGFAVWLLGAAGLAVAAPEAAARGAPTAQNPIVIGWAPPDITGVYRTATEYFEASVRAANEAGIPTQLLTRTTATHTAFADQVAILEDMILRRVDVIAVAPTEVEAVRAVLRRANERDIPVMVVNLLEPIRDVRASYIGFDNQQAAMVTAYAIADYFGGPGVLGTGRHVAPQDGYIDLAFYRSLYDNLPAEERAAIRARGAIIEGIAGGFFSTMRLKGFDSVIRQFPGIEILGHPCAADWNRARAIACTEDMMRVHATNLDFIWGNSSEHGIGAMLAVEAAGRLARAEEAPSPGDRSIAIFSNGVTPESTARIAEGRMLAETTHGFVDWGWHGGALAVRMACRLEVPQIYDIRPRIAFRGNASDFFPSPRLPYLNWAQIRQDCRR